MQRSFSTLLGLLVLSAPGLVPPAAAQTASLVHDIHPARSSSSGSSPRQLWSFRGKVLFAAREQSSGRELWSTDGTGSGTRMLADFFPGAGFSDQHILGTMGPLLFGVAIEEASCCGTLRSYLWRSDGTREGTFLLDPLLQVAIPYERDFGDPGEVAGAPVALADEAVYFAGCAGGEDCGVWRTDGTVEGTKLLKTVSGSFNGSYPQELTVAGERLFFVRAQQLWTSDGTPEGTTPLQDFPFGFLHPRHLVALGNQVLFLAPAAAQGAGEELWASDGTAAGTRALTSFAVAEPFKQTHFLKVLGDKVYFVADDATHGAEIWASDGTSAGTVRVTNFDFHDPFNGPNNSSGDGLSFPEMLEKVGDRLIFWADDAVSGLRLWSSRGTLQSTAPVCPACTLWSESRRFVELDGRLLFFAAAEGYGTELWTTDGTAAGTKLVKDTCPGFCDGVGSHLVLLPGRVFFTGPGVESYESALWTSDGTPQGTRRFASPLVEPNSQPQVAALGGKIVFSALVSDDSAYHAEELWVSDGTPAGSRQISTIGREGASSEIEDLVAAGDHVFFTAEDQENRFVWRSTGTSEGTAKLPILPVPGFGDARLLVAGETTFLIWEDYPSGDQIWRVLDDGGFQQLTTFGENHRVHSPVAYKGRLYFLLDGRELWSSDGTVPGTGNFSDPFDVESVAFLQAAGSELWFLADTPSSFGLSQVWRTDGTQAGTRLVHDFGVYRTSGDPEFTAVGSNVYFVAVRPGGDDFDYQVWKSDGSGVTMITDFPGLSSLEGQPAELTAFQGNLYFMANLPESPARRGLWRSDGTAAGTGPVKLFPLAYDLFQAPRHGLTAVGSRLVFTANDGVHGNEPWTSDGTPGGTVLLRDVFPGPGSSEPSGYQEAAGHLYFSALDGAHGFELWRTDGTPQGTRLVQDIAPEGASSDPAGFTVAGGRLFFHADDGVTGNELWTLPLSGPACQPSATALCLNGGRFKVESTWQTTSGAFGRGRTVPMAADTGAFWFFDAANIETILKVLDGRGLNGHFWVFYGALSDVDYTLTVTDTQIGLARRYANPPGQLASVGDTQAFGPLGARAPRLPSSTGAKPFTAERIDAAAATGTCVPGASRLCLNGGRFAVEASWKDFNNQTGSGTAVSMTSDTGYFWFFDESNVEAVLKVLDGTAVNGRFWVFYGALSNVEYTLTVTDTLTGKVKTYRNPKGQFASVADTSAF